jgi:hypothetical protein
MFGSEESGVAVSPGVQKNEFTRSNPDNGESGTRTSSTPMPSDSPSCPGRSLHHLKIHCSSWWWTTGQPGSEIMRLTSADAKSLNHTERGRQEIFAANAQGRPPEAKRGCLRYLILVVGDGI